LANEVFLGGADATPTENPAVPIDPLEPDPAITNAKLPLTDAVLNAIFCCAKASPTKAEGKLVPTNFTRVASTT
jgi:hypothetical protein